MAAYYLTVKAKMDTPNKINGFGKLRVTMWRWLTKSKPNSNLWSESRASRNGAIYFLNTLQKV